MTAVITANAPVAAMTSVKAAAFAVTTTPRRGTVMNVVRMARGAYSPATSSTPRMPSSMVAVVPPVTAVETAPALPVMVRSDSARTEPERLDRAEHEHEAGRNTDQPQVGAQAAELDQLRTHCATQHCRIPDLDATWRAVSAALGCGAMRELLLLCWCWAGLWGVHRGSPASSAVAGGQAGGRRIGALELHGAVGEVHEGLLERAGPWGELVDEETVVQGGLGDVASGQSADLEQLRGRSLHHRSAAGQERGEGSGVVCADGDRGFARREKFGGVDVGDEATSCR